MTPRLRLLGRARVFDGQRWLDAPYDKRFALLAYLACAEASVERDKLAFLFWADVEEARARRDLSYLIYRTKKLSFASTLEAQPPSLCWHIETDVRSFRQALAQQEWAAAVALYGGELLQGLHLDDSPEFMAWLELDRKNLHSLWRKAVIERAGELESASRHLEAADLLKELLDNGALDEEAVQLYLRNAFLGGQRDLALQTYERFASELERELGLKPLPATQELVQALRGGASIAPGPERIAGPKEPAPKSLHNFPTERTPFVGRDFELTEIVNALSQPDCRLLTLVGPGGIGKTRLALQVAADVAAGYADGVTFVPLASVSAATFLASAIAGALSFSFYGQAGPETQLLKYLRDQEMLLVLDNLEHLLEGVGLIAAIRKTCPSVKILATSRERISLASEWLFQVEGMSLPESKETAGLESFDAVQLFLRCARRVQADFALNEENCAAIVRICGLVGGAPLGIELASAWLQLLTCDEIAEEMRKDLDLLASQLHDLSERHRSLRKVFEHSWRLLSGEEQAAFRRLAVFQGGFARNAAEQVAEVSMRSLLALVSKSLIQRTAGGPDTSLLNTSPSGRFSLHPLLLQYAREILAENSDNQTCYRRHAEYFLAVAQAAEPHLTGPGQAPWLSILDVEHDNLRAAFDWFKVHDIDLAMRLAAALWRFWIMRAHNREGRARLEELAALPEAQARTKARASILHALGTITFETGDFARAQPVLQEALGILREQGETHEVANVLNTLGWIVAHLGETQTSKALSEEALALHRQLGSVRGWALALATLGFQAFFRGQFPESFSYLAECLQLREQLGDERGVAYAKAILVRTLWHMGRFKEASELITTSLLTLRQLDDKQLISWALYQQGNIYLNLGHIREADTALQESLSLAREVGNLNVLGMVLTAFADLLTEQGRYDGALKPLEEAQGIWREVGYPWAEALTHRAAARVAYHQARSDAAQHVLGMSLQIALDIEDQYGIAECLERLASLNMEINPAEAARLLAAAGRIREIIQAPLPPRFGPRHKQRLDVISQQLGPKAFKASWQAGEEAVLDGSLESMLAAIT
jgi:predicted ATPase/DNA-binding SARP family transcriptional activator